MSIEKIKNIDFHDQSMEQFTIDFSLKTIKIKFSIYNDESSLYDDLRLDFPNIENFKMSNIELEELTSIEVSSFDISELKDKVIVKIVLLLSFSGPDAVISFNCSDIIMT